MLVVNYLFHKVDLKLIHSYIQKILKKLCVKCVFCGWKCYPMMVPFSPTGAILAPVNHLRTKLPPKKLILPLIKAPASVL